MARTFVRTARVSQVVGYLLDGVTPLPGEDLDADLGAWLGGSSRFLTFAEENRDKIRKKLRVANDPGARGDVRAELEVARLLLADRRITLAFEAYGSGRRGPDFTVTFRTSHRFNLEVTRPRLRESEERSEAIGQAVLAKLRQLPADAPNAIFVATGLAEAADELAAAMRALKLRGDRREEDYFARRGLNTAEFQASYRRMAVLFVAKAGGGVFAWTNPEARRPLPEGAAAACVGCFAEYRPAGP